MIITFKRQLVMCLAVRLVFLREGILTLVLFSFSFFAFAQEADIERFTPKVVPQEEGEIIRVFPDKMDLQLDEQILVDRLNALILFDDVAEFDRSTQVRASGIELEKLDTEDKAALEKLLHTFLSKPITLKLLDEINQSIVEFYRLNDRPIVDVFAPEGQDITDGVVKIVVIFGRRGEVSVEGSDHFSPESILDQIRIGAGDVLSESALRAELDWFNQNPFRKVNLIMQRGQEFGTTDLVFDVTGRRPYRFYGGLEDSGTGLTGKERWFSGFNWGNVFGLNHQLNYQFTSAFDIDVLNAHSFSYIAPLPWRHTLDIFGAYVESAPDITSTGFTIEGQSWQLGARYRIPMKNFHSLRHDIQLGYDFKRSNNNLEFGSVSVFSSFTTVSQFVLGYKANLADKLGTTQAGLKLFISPGDMFSDNTDVKFTASRADASSDYMMLRFNVERLTRLPVNFSWYTEFSLQASNENLLGSEQLGIGGYQSVRGYDDYQVVADEGIVFRNEIRSPEYSILKIFGLDQFPDQFQALVFTDYGIVSNRHPLQGEESVSLLSAGVGFRYSVFPYLTARFDYGWQLKEITRGNDRDNRVHLGLVLAY